MRPAQVAFGRRVRARGRYLRRRARLWGYAWRRSLRLRVVSTTVVIGIGSLLLLGTLLSTQVRDGIFDDRAEQVLADAASRTQSAQDRFDSATANSTQAVQQLANDTVRSLQETAVGTAGVVLLRSQDATGPIEILPFATDPRLRALITPLLSQAVREQDRQQWQSVAMPVPGEAGVTAPGIAVGSRVLIPGAGEHELYFIYSLAAEQDTLWLLQRALAVGGLALVAMLVLMTWYITRQVLDPVQQAAKVAATLSAGGLDVRMRVVGRDELALLARSFNDMAQNLQDQIERLAELSRMQQRFVSDVSHELRTPLTTIRMASELLYESREQLPAAQRRSVELLATQLDRFEALLADLLEISRFDAGAVELEAEQSDLRGVVDRVVGLTEAIAADRGSWLDVDLPAVGVAAELDSRRIERVVRNLVVNAIEHGEGHPIEIRVGAGPRAVAVSVRDHGVGMTARQAEHVFDRFWRADPARQRTLGGTGLGLAIALEDVRLHGGALEAWGSPGEGACFRLTLPRRAGMTIDPASESPLPLRPDRTAAETERPATDPSGPAAVPELDQEEQ
ncbi:HAMP domain-containing protein [Pseudactinotalea sp. HY158]|nr:HAMP domain-containing protein [Pseudactinotalea sp. HY158]